MILKCFGTPFSTAVPGSQASNKFHKRDHVGLMLQSKQIGVMQRCLTSWHCSMSRCQSSTMRNIYFFKSENKWILLEEVPTKQRLKNLVEEHWVVVGGTVIQYVKIVGPNQLQEMCHLGREGIFSVFLRPMFQCTCNYSSSQESTWQQSKWEVTEGWSRHKHGHSCEWLFRCSVNFLQRKHAQYRWVTCGPWHHFIRPLEPPEPPHAFITLESLPIHFLLTLLSVFSAFYVASMQFQGAILYFIKWNWFF